MDMHIVFYKLAPAYGGAERCTVEFAKQLARRLDVPAEKMILPPANCGDLYTSSIPYGLAECRRTGRDKAQTIALLLVCGSGIQIGAAIYHF